MSAKGQAKTAGSGRKKGTPNKITGDIRAMLKEALEQVGGVDYLVRVAHENIPAFTQMIAKTIPKEIDAQLKGDMTLIIETGVPRKP